MHLPRRRQRLAGWRRQPAQRRKTLHAAHCDEEHGAGRTRKPLRSYETFFFGQ